MPIRIRQSLGLSLSIALLSCGARPAPALASPVGSTCTAERAVPLVPTDLALCEALDPVIRKPSAQPLDEYQENLGTFLGNFCHRRSEAGWKRDKSVRDTGPYTATLVNDAWKTQYGGTHAPVVIWYSPEMVTWVKANRPAEAEGPSNPPDVPDGAVMIKEMYPAPAASCVDADPLTLLPSSGAAVMVRDAVASHDGWFWGWFGWDGWDADWPATRENRYPYMGFGQYCVNCHASAENNATFASAVNIEGEPGQPLVFLSQHFADAPQPEDHHRLVSLPSDDAPRLGEPYYDYNAAFLAGFPKVASQPSWDDVAKMPSETYDNVWVPSGGPKHFVTSDQCIGCHDAGATGIQFDMTAISTNHPGLLDNLSPYAMWRSSPMGMAGRDPIFFSQLDSEINTFHPEKPDFIQDTCLGCHGVMGERQHAIDTHEQSGKCPDFLRQDVEPIPFPDGVTDATQYAALARDGISCAACHHMALGDQADPDAEYNQCTVERQEALNGGLEGFAKTFTGSFLVGPADEVIGPFADPKTKPMEHALGIRPVEQQTIASSELCGTCHTVHLPILHKGETIGHVYEQTTYPEWAFSAYRTGTSPYGDLPFGAGDRVDSCQGCHMPTEDDDGTPFQSKIAGIQEYTNFPQSEHSLPPEDIDLDVREGYGRHTLVGLNVFFVKMAQQFPDVLGIRTQDPMLVSKGVDPLIATEQAMLDQASNDTATLSVQAVPVGDALQIDTTVTSHVGHKFPSGVGFRRAFVQLEVLDARGAVLWASGRTNALGMIIDDAGEPVDGEVWWSPDCERVNLLDHQPHYANIDAQDQVQIYQELSAAAPKDGPTPVCGGEVGEDWALTTSFLSICAKVKDNRVLPDGFLPLAKRKKIAAALGADALLAEEAGAEAVNGDPDYQTGGGDTTRYVVDTRQLGGIATSVRASLYYQAIPPFYLQDRFCTGKTVDTDRLYFLTVHLNLENTQAEGWKLLVTQTETPLFD